MIDTKEQYERAKYVADTQSGPTLGEAMETIEALREVARLVRILDLPRLADWTSSVQGALEDWEWPQDIHNLQMKLDALPDWLTE